MRGVPTIDHEPVTNFASSEADRRRPQRCHREGLDKGILFDRTPRALTGVPFDLDILSDDNTALWQPYGEQWCVELEVNHNPLAAHRFGFDLLPGATRWFEVDGEIVCSTIWKQQVLPSITLLTRSSASG